jgi:F-type H+-transporting ATPase subunit alpha
LFHSGIRPAVDVGISVSRVGGHAQPEAMKQVAPKLRLDLALFRELQDFARLGTELDQASKLQLQRGQQMVEILKQKQFSPLSTAQQVISILAGSSHLLDDIETSSVTHFIKEMLDWLKLETPEYLEQIDRENKFDDKLMESLTEAIRAFKMIYKFSYGK